VARLRKVLTSALVSPNAIPVSIEFKHILTCSFSSGNCLHDAPKVFHLSMNFSTDSPSHCRTEANSVMLTSRSDEKKFDMKTSCISSHVRIDPEAKLEYHRKALLINDDLNNHKQY